MALKAAPINTKNQATKVNLFKTTNSYLFVNKRILKIWKFKDRAFQVILNVLRSFPNANATADNKDIENAVKSLDMDLVDILMKYIYKGFEKEPKFSNVFLNWHDKVIKQKLYNTSINLFYHWFMLVLFSTSGVCNRW
jgi:hypothetical protein